MIEKERNVDGVEELSLKLNYLPVNASIAQIAKKIDNGQRRNELIQ
jgi:hypothetical protein